MQSYCLQTPELAPSLRHSESPVTAVHKCYDPARHSESPVTAVDKCYDPARHSESPVTAVDKCYDPALWANVKFLTINRQTVTERSR